MNLNVVHLLVSCFSLSLFSNCLFRPGWPENRGFARGGVAKRRRLARASGRRTEGSPLAKQPRLQGCKADMIQSELHFQKYENE
jgi:hypothetical protein